ncbi:hypothetical protein [Streptomyces yaizuensis]|uniref:PQQ-binding-like beta-propeller repeat protein n=1 Tax=Streptomyces yaizuensis TaxID=2989713 RepID=A0ABQ5NUY7_9ACTN|nr:hypothetical protein [Streptomyces sp. YSPA8]GLF93968.1 PQQ-binding-like beta-propeller repeat protein [Streptomyces sp. YSPA8]
MRQRRVTRTVLAAGAAVLALLLLWTLAGGDGFGGGSGGGAGTGGDGGGGQGQEDRRPGAAGTGTGTGTAAPVDRPVPPPSYAPAPRWEISDLSPEYAVARTTGRIAHLARIPGGDGDRFRVRTHDTATGRPSWSGPALRPAGVPEGGADDAAAVPFPRLLPVTRDGREYFVVWSFGRTTPADGTDDRMGDAPAAGADGADGADRADGADGADGTDGVGLAAGTSVVLELYDAADGSRRRVELPWPGAPTVSGDGPGVLIADGGTRNAVVDPATGEVSEVRGKALGHPRGCAGCRRLTEVRGLTERGLLVGGESGFWVRGGWYSATVAPPGTAPSSGVPVSVLPGHLLAKWRPARGRQDARTHEIWAVHDTRSGRVLATARCHRPEIDPGDRPRAVLSPRSGYLVSGQLAFDLGRKKGYCFDQADGAPPLVLTSVTDDGTAYGALNARDAADALAGGGTPVELAVAQGSGPRPLPPHIRLPAAEVSGLALLTWTDARDHTHLTAHPRTGAPPGNRTTDRTGGRTGGLTGGLTGGRATDRLGVSSNTGDTGDAGG